MKAATQTKKVEVVMRFILMKVRKKNLTKRPLHHQGKKVVNHPKQERLYPSTKRFLNKYALKTRI
jgi:hypothetical protein